MDKEIEYILENWGDITPGTQQMLRLIGISPQQESTVESNVSTSNAYKTKGEEHEQGNELLAR